jgi:hypothetical protein
VTDLDLAAVTTQYSAPLEDAGWRVSSQGEGDRVRWSVRDVAEKDGEPWRAYLFIFQQRSEALPPRYSLPVGRI